MRRFTIGRLAADAGVTVETIRYYERRGLLTRPPAPAGGGYREYSARDLAIMRNIKLGKELGFQLGEMRRLIPLLGTGPRFCDAFQDLMRKKLSWVRKEQERLSQIDRRLDQALLDCTARGGHGDCPIQQSLTIRGATLPLKEKSQAAGG